MPIGVWQEITPGLEQRIDIPDGDTLAQVALLRIDPARYTLRAHYRPGDPQTLMGWQQALPDAAAIINANFFTPEHTVLGLLIADGEAFGTPYTDQGGTFWIDAQTGLPRLEANRAASPEVGESSQAVQAFPMLVEGGAQVYFDTAGDRVTRRTAIAIDDAGRVLWIVTPLLGMRLADLAAFLVEGEYGVVDALNLDGGGSTLMAIPAIRYTLVSLDPVPVVLAIYPS
jgi:uncharacterized protein YigE (DUF2233 family)